MSEDQHISWDIGRLYHTRVKSEPYEMFSVGCICVYHSSGYVIIKCQVSLNATESVKSKLAVYSESHNQRVLEKGTILIMGYLMPQILWRLG